MKTPLLPLATSCLVLAACQAPAPQPAPVAGAPATGMAVAARTASIQVTPSYRDGAVRRLMEALTAYTIASITHMEVKVYSVDGQGNESFVVGTDVPAASLNKTITFGNLAHNSDYRIRAFAYKAAGTAASDKISTDGASYVDVPVGLDDRPGLGNLVVTLIDQTFAGEATTPGLTVNGGGITHSGSLGLTLNSQGVTTLAGDGTADFADGTGAAARFDNPIGLAIDADGDMYLADHDNRRIRKISPAGVVSTVAGTGADGQDDTSALSSTFTYVQGVLPDAAGNLYVADAGKIRKISAAGVVTTLAGQSGLGFADGTGAAAHFWAPEGMDFAGNGDLIVADQGNHRIRRVTPAGVVTTIAGDGSAAFANDNGTAASFNFPYDVAVDTNGDIYVADSNNYRIRLIEPDGDVLTFAGDGTSGLQDGTGAGARFVKPSALAFDDAGDLWVADGTAIRRINKGGVVTTVAGTSTADHADGTLAAARFNGVNGIVLAPNGVVFLTDNVGNRVRKLVP